MRAVVVAVLVSSSAHADPNADAIDTLARAPLADRGIVLGTALTVPAGEVELSVRTVIVAGEATVAIGITPTTELWVDAALGVALDHTYAVGLKQVIVHRPAWQLALEGAARHITEYDSDSYDPVGTLSFGPTLGGRADAFALTAIASACADDCRALFYAWLDASYGGEHVRGIVELAAVPGVGGAFGMVGLRAGWRHVAVDVGLGYASVDAPIVLPVISAAYRP
jgi:hypothetical protein